MLARILSVGLLAGLVAGLLVAALQQVTTTPLIIAAEAFETKAPAPSHADARKADDHGAHEHDEGWKPADGLPRFFYTSLATVVTAIGLALVLLAAMVAAGERIDERHAIAWAIAGFVAFGLAPAAGLAPELPGSAAGDLVARQIWWVGTACATAIAIWMFLKTEKALFRVLALAVLVAPHVIGAPQPHELESRAPAEFAARFAALSLAVQACLWLLVGIAVGLLWPRLAPKPAT
ncbi:CbtA family protein [Reyranella sp.]|jgi:cobalt transporter subunit CbtA|uniref:CbtA family protein n=1 Tax=Reyranella sp. TaxID=1929291 RepID=UPI002F943A50